MKTLAGLAITLIATSAWAGRFEVVGEGSATVAAEFVKINIETKSECHISALAAREASDRLAEDAIHALKVFTAPIPEQLQTAPGDNIHQLKTVYINNEQEIICDESHAWSSSTLIQFKLNDLRQLASLQDALLALNPPAVGAEIKNIERLSLTLSRPVPGVLAETWDKMSDLALQRAMQNALRQVNVLTAGTTEKVELLKVQGTTSSNGQPIYDRVDSEGDTAGISLGKVSLKMARLFTYKVGQ